MKALVLVLRGLPAGAIGPYGNRWIETPTLDALAARGVVYDWHFAADQLLTERYDFGALAGAAVGPPVALARELREAGVRVVPALDNDGEERLAELAGEDGWLLWVEHDVSPPWDIADEILEAYFAPPAEAEVEGDEDDEDTGEEYLDEEETIEPLFSPSTGPIDPADDILFRRIQTTFAAAVTQLDLMLGELLDEVGEDVLLIVTSDHGRALGEHGVVGPCRPWLHEEIVHVPLILAGPGCPPGRRIDALTASIDLAPTLAAHFGAALPDAHGHDIHPAVLADGGPREYVCLSHQVGDDIEWGLRTRDWAFRLPRGGEPPRLYVKPDDRCEVNDVAQHHPDLVESLERTLRAFAEATRADGPLVPPPLQLTTPPPS